MNSHGGFRIKEDQIDVLDSNFSGTRVNTNTCNCEGSLKVELQGQILFIVFKVFIKTVNRPSSGH
jgi:hypothetical protein